MSSSSSSSHNLIIAAHHVQVPENEKDHEKIYDLKMEKVIELIKENLSNCKTERTMILTTTDRYLNWTTALLDNNGYRGTTFPAKYMDEDHHVLGYSTQEFLEGTHNFAASHIKVFKTDCARLAQHYILFDIPEELLDTRTVFKMIQQKAATSETPIQVDIITIGREKSSPLMAIALEMGKRGFELPEYLKRPHLQQLAQKEKEEAARLAEARKRYRSPSPQTVYDVKPDANGIYHYPSKFLCKRLRLGLKADEDSDESEGEEEEEVRNPNYNSDDELPNWMFN